MQRSKYTQREWDRVVGYGQVPDEYRFIPSDYTNGQDSKRGQENREEVKRVVAETNPTETHEIP